MNSDCAALPISAPRKSPMIGAKIGQSFRTYPGVLGSIGSDSQVKESYHGYAEDEWTRNDYRVQRVAT